MWAEYWATERSLVVLVLMLLLFKVRGEKPYNHPWVDKWEPLESFHAVDNQPWRDCCRMHRLLLEVMKHLLSL